MNYQKGQKVILRDKSEKYIDGTLLEVVDFGDPEIQHWWVQYMENGHIEVNIISIEKLDELNKDPTVSLCVCGSTKAGVSNRHTTWCNIK